jgi:hypothetical protein
MRSTLRLYKEPTLSYELVQWSEYEFGVDSRQPART